MGKPMVLEMDFQSSNPCVRGFNDCFCNWGVRKTPYDVSGNLKGKTAPLWVNPTPKLYLALFIVALVTAILFLAPFVVIEHHPCIDKDEFPFYPKKKAIDFVFWVLGTIVLFANAFTFLFLYVKEYASDEEWFRYFIINNIFLVLMLVVFALDIFFMIKNFKNYNDKWKDKKSGFGDNDTDYYKIFNILTIVYIVFNLAVVVLDIILEVIIFKDYVFAKFVEHSASCDDEDIIIMDN